MEREKGGLRGRKNGVGEKGKEEEREGGEGGEIRG